MSSQPTSESAVEPATDQKPLVRKNAQGVSTRSAVARLGELQRALQRQLRRKANEFEETFMDRAALLTLRAEIAALDPKAKSDDVVRLDNAARRARADFERVAGIRRRNKQGRSMADIEKEIASHV